MITSTDATVDVTVEWNVPGVSAEWARTRQTRVTLIEGYSTRASIPNILSIRFLVGTDYASFVNVISVSGDENVDWT